MQTGEIRQPNAPLARDPWACRRLLDASLLILREVDPQLADNKWAQISPDGKVRPVSLSPERVVCMYNPKGIECLSPQCLD